MTRDEIIALLEQRVETHRKDVEYFDEANSIIAAGWCRERQAEVEWLLRVIHSIEDDRP